MATKPRPDDAALFGLDDLDPATLETAVNARGVEDDLNPDQISDAENLLSTLRASDLNLEDSPAAETQPLQGGEEGRGNGTAVRQPTQTAFSAFAPPGVPPAPSDRAGMVVAANGHPFREIDAANFKCTRLREETGESFYVASLPGGGYAIFPQASAVRETEPAHATAVPRTDRRALPHTSQPDSSDPSPYEPRQPKYDRRDTSLWKLEDFPDGHPVHKYGLKRYKQLMKKNCKVKQAYRSQLTLLLVTILGFILWAAPEAIMAMIYGADGLADLSQSINLETVATGFSLFGVAMMAFAVLKLGYIRLNFRYLLAPNYAKSETGIIAKKTTKMNYVNILTTDLHISVIGRIFNYGSIELSTAGESGAEILMRNVHYPELLQSVIEARVAEAKRQT